MESRELFPTLLRARRQKGLTQTQLTQYLGLPQSYISEVEKGKHDVKMSTLMAWAKVLDLEVMLIPRQQVLAVSYLVKVGSSEQQEIPPAYGPLPDKIE